MNKDLVNSLKQTEDFFANASDEKIQEYLNELFVYEYDGITIDEFLSNTLPYEEFINEINISAQGYLITPEIVDNYPLIDWEDISKPNQYIPENTDTKIEKRGSKASLSFFIYICPN